MSHLFRWLPGWGENRFLCVSWRIFQSSLLLRWRCYAGRQKVPVGMTSIPAEKTRCFLCVIFWEIPIFLHRVSIPFASNGIFIEKETGYYKISSDEYGFVVKIDISGNIQILLQEKHYNKTCGLCGNFNKFAEDDFRTQEGRTMTNWLYFNVHSAHLSWWVIQQRFCWSSTMFPQNLSFGETSSWCTEKLSD